MSTRDDQQSRLKEKHHRMTPIEHFLLDIIEILLRDWIENIITDIGRCKVATHIFLPTYRNLSLQTLADNIFLR